MNPSTNKAANLNPAMKPFHVLAGVWKTKGSHPQFPGVVLDGLTSFTWIEGGAFLRMHSTITHEKFPEGIAIFGSDDALGKFSMIYFDERAVSRIQEVRFEGPVLKWWRNAPGFSQRYMFTFSEDGNTITSKGELSVDDKTFEKDLEQVYTRVG